MIPRCRERLPDVELTLKEMVTTDQYTSQIHSTLALVRGGLGTALAPEAPMSLRFDGSGVPSSAAGPLGSRSRAVHGLEEGRRQSRTPQRVGYLSATLSVGRSNSPTMMAAGRRSGPRRPHLTPLSEQLSRA